MTCDRCQHEMQREWIVHGLHWWWACRACGERIDGTILRHRAEQAYVESWVRDGMERERREWTSLFRADAAPILRVPE